MKGHPVFLVVFLFTLTLAVAFGAEPAPEGRIKVLVVTGGHGFSREPFFKMFSDNPEIAFKQASHGAEGATAYERPDLLDYDVVVLYDMQKTITPQQQARLRALTEKGLGLVVLHHALVSYQHWADYERIIGGRYPEEDGKGGVVTEQVGYQHDIDLPVVIARDHPVTAGLKDFVIHDEIYWGYRVGSDVTALLTTTLPKSGKPLAWTRQEGRSRVVYVQMGHGPEAFGNRHYRQLVAQSIRWVAGREGNPRARGWISLFDGSTLNGWVQKGGKARYQVEGGELVGTCVPNTANAFLCTTQEFGDFELEVEFKVDPDLNSGVQIRSQVFDEETSITWQGKTIRVPAGRVHGLQVEIDPSARAWTGGVYEEGARGWLNNLADSPPARNAFKAGDWNRFHIECRRESIKTWLNDVPAADLKDNRVAKGFIALQVHGVRDREKPLQVRFRSVRLRPWDEEKQIQ